MWSLSISCAILALCVTEQLVGAKIMLRRHGPPYLQTKSTFKTSVWHTIEQQVDNFNNADNRTWDMRYISMADFYKEGGPIFIDLGGEWIIKEGYLEAGLLGDIGKEHHSYMFYTEHRYYGYSQPMPDWSTKNMKYLSIDQALADVAYFIEYIKTTMPSLENSKVIVHGSSYSGIMATWMRLKYPHLVDAVWASSAPIVAQVDFSECYEVIGDNIKLISPECYQTIESASQKMFELLQTEEGRQELSEHFYTCTPLRGDFPYDQHFWNTYTDLFANLVLFALPGDIQAMCDELQSSEGNNDVEKMGAFVQGYNNGSCLEDYDNFLELYGTGNITDKILRPWYYQMCTELGLLQALTTPNHPFVQNAVTPAYFERICEDFFGPDFAFSIEDAVKRTNRVYGGRNPALTKVVSIHGSVDPAHPPGITESLNELAPAMLVQGYSHCSDSESLSPSDSEEMQQAKKLIKESIAKWIQ